MNSLFLLTLLFAVSASVAGIPVAEGSADRNKIVIHCEENEMWYECGRCEGTCDNMDPVCPMMCRPSCSCIEGHVRHGKDRRCIPKSQCSQVEPVELRPPVPGRVHPPVCGDKEVLFPCGACDGSCSNTEPICLKICQRPSCGCMKDHVRESKGRACIHKSECPIMPLIERPPPVDIRQPPADIRQPPADIREPPADIRQPPADIRHPPADIREPLGDMHLPPADIRVPFPELRPKRCPVHEEWFPCGACDGSCLEFEPVCTKICREGSCGCMKEHVREPKGHSCIHVRDCPMLMPLIPAGN